MADSVAAFRADSDVAEAYAALEDWLHRAERSASPSQIADAVRAGLETRDPEGVAS